MAGDNRDRWYEPLIRLLRAAAYIFAHTLTAVLLITAITLVSDWLEDRGNPAFFGQIPMRYFFEAMDMAILVVFVFYGIAEAIRAFRR